MGILLERYGSSLVPVKILRMPAEITLLVARKTSEQIWRIKKIFDIIRKDIEAREIEPLQLSKKVKTNECCSAFEREQQHRRKKIKFDGRKPLFQLFED